MNQHLPSIWVVATIKANAEIVHPYLKIRLLINFIILIPPFNCFYVDSIRQLNYNIHFQEISVIFVSGWFRPLNGISPCFLPLSPSDNSIISYFFGKYPQFPWVVDLSTWTVEPFHSSLKFWIRPAINNKNTIQMQVEIKKHRLAIWKPVITEKNTLTTDIMTTQFFLCRLFSSLFSRLFLQSTGDKASVPIVVITKIGILYK